MNRLPVTSLQPQAHVSLSLFSKSLSSETITQPLTIGYTPFEMPVFMAKIRPAFPFKNFPVARFTISGDKSVDKSL